jgi:hypothetical protein
VGVPTSPFSLPLSVALPCLGAVVAALILAFRHLWWWILVAAACIALLPVVLCAARARISAGLGRWLALTAVAAVLVAGLSQLVPPSPPAGSETTLNDTEGDSYIERDLAHWLASHAAPDSRPLVLAPSSLTTTLCFHGGLRGLGTINWENDEGNTAAVRIASASSMEEAAVMLNSRGVTHVVLPSWDPSLDNFAAIGLRTTVGSVRFDQSFIGSLHRWEIPAWLRPVAYPLPPAAGADRTLTIFEVVEEQSPPVALSRQAEYFIEMQQPRRLNDIAQALRPFPGDVVALTALAEIEFARGDAVAGAATVGRLVPFVARAARRPMPFDRRLSLAILLAQQRQTELAKAQLERCLADADEARLRSLSVLSLYRFHVLCRLYGKTLPDARLREAALQLLRPDLRARLSG